MNTGSFAAGFQQQACFNFYPNGAAFGAQNTQIRAPLQFITQHPGTYQMPSQQPGTNQQFLQHPDDNLFLAQHMGTTLSTTLHPGVNQYPAQYPGTAQYSTLHTGQSQFGGTSPHTGTSTFQGPPHFTRIPPNLGKAEYLGHKQPFPERKPFPSFQFQQVTTQSHNGTQQTNGNIFPSPVNNFTANQYNFQFAKSTGMNDQTQNSNLHQFVGPNAMKREPANPQNNFQNVMARKISRKPETDKCLFLDREKDSGSKAMREEKKEQTTEEALEQVVEEVQRRQKEKDRIINIIRIQHLISSYVKVRSLCALCRDFQTPVFGDLPDGNEVEKSVIRNLSYFLKEEITKIKFHDLEERAQITCAKFDKDPILRASFPVIKNAITRLEIKKSDFEKAKKKIEMLEKEIKDFFEELKLKEMEAKTLKSEIEAEKARMEKLSERLNTERKNNETVRHQFEKELEEINNIQIHGLHEDLRALQEKISKETKILKQSSDEIKSLKEQNSCLKACIAEAGTKKDDPNNKSGQPTMANKAQNGDEIQAAAQVFPVKKGNS